MVRYTFSAMDLHHLLLAGFTGALKCAPLLLLQAARHSVRRSVVLSTDFPQAMDSSRREIADSAGACTRVRRYAYPARFQRIRRTYRRCAKCNLMQAAAMDLAQAGVASNSVLRSVGDTTRRPRQYSSSRGKGMALVSGSASAELS